MQSLKDILNTLDLKLDLDDDAIVTDVLVIAKVQRLDGKTSVVHAVTEGTDWITKIGLAQVCLRTVTQLEDFEG